MDTPLPATVVDGQAEERSAPSNGALSPRQRCPCWTHTTLRMDGARAQPAWFPTASDPPQPELAGYAPVLTAAGPCPHS
eukprot:363864-Chlamydomonas_euryale.AAC.5